MFTLFLLLRSYYLQHNLGVLKILDDCEQGASDYADAMRDLAARGLTAHPLHPTKPERSVSSKRDLRHGVTMLIYIVCEDGVR